MTTKDNHIRLPKKVLYQMVYLVVSCHVCYATYSCYMLPLQLHLSV